MFFKILKNFKEDVPMWHILQNLTSAMTNSDKNGSSNFITSYNFLSGMLLSCYFEINQKPRFGEVKKKNLKNNFKAIIFVNSIK